MISSQRPDVRRLLWLVMVVAVVVLAAGCRTAPPLKPAAPSSQAWEQARTQLQARQAFSLKGRVAVAAGKDGFNAAMRWAQTGTRSQVALEGPLGVGAVQITADGNTLSIINSHGDHLDSDAAHAELVQKLGFDPPLTSLRYWILGVPDPATPSQETLDPQQQRLQSLTQAGWQIDYGSYVAAGDGALPGKLTVQRTGVRVRLIVDSWN